MLPVYIVGGLTLLEAIGLAVLAWFERPQYWLTLRIMMWVGGLELFGGLIFLLFWAKQHEPVGMHAAALLAAASINLVAIIAYGAYMWKKYGENPRTDPYKNRFHMWRFNASLYPRY